MLGSVTLVGRAHQWQSPLPSSHPPGFLPCSALSHSFGSGPLQTTVWVSVFCSNTQPYSLSSFQPQAQPSLVTWGSDKRRGGGEMFSVQTVMEGSPGGEGSPEGP